jgi:hypothetical protein
MQPQGMPAIALPIAPPPLLRLTSLRCLLFLRFQFSTAYRSAWPLRPIGAALVSPRKPLDRIPIKSRSTKRRLPYEFHQ